MPHVLVGQAPIGSKPFTNNAYYVTPTIAAGKGDFDIQATVGTPWPTSNYNKLGTQLVTNVASMGQPFDYWGGRCPITGIDQLELLRASHIKAWADCTTDAERLDVFNGLLLAAHLDAAFDAALITFADDGALMISDRLTERSRATLGLKEGLRLAGITPRHAPYLAWHRRLFSQLPPRPTDHSSN